MQTGMRPSSTWNCKGSTANQRRKSSLKSHWSMRSKSQWKLVECSCRSNSRSSRKHGGSPVSRGCAGVAWGIGIGTRRSLSSGRPGCLLCLGCRPQCGPPWSWERRWRRRLLRGRSISCGLLRFWRLRLFVLGWLDNIRRCERTTPT